jgi:hypothetical protein
MPDGIPIVGPDTPDNAYGPGPVRAFLYPGGGAWTVSVVQPEQGEAPVLRFASGPRHVDLTEWPSDWVILPYEWLVALLRRVPRTGPPTGPQTPRRRWTDPGAPTA